MIHKHQLRTALAIAAFSFVAVSPALAQGKGEGNGRGKNRPASVQAERGRPTLQRRIDRDDTRRPRYEDRSRDRYDDRRDRDDRDSRDRYDNRRRRPQATWEDILFGRDEHGRTRVPPGWCRGRGNPHNTPENCGYSNRRYDWDYRDRYGGYGSYAEAHRAFHRALDREYAARAERHRNDPFYLIRLRAEKAADHAQWHERTGTRHS
ncbi:MAG TPA: hypothetical protein VF167_05450 [Longimicrobiaceae bacterium]